MQKFKNPDFKPVEFDQFGIIPGCTIKEMKVLTEVSAVAELENLGGGDGE